MKIKLDRLKAKRIYKTKENLKGLESLKEKYENRIRFNTKRNGFIPNILHNKK